MGPFKTEFKSHADSCRSPPLHREISCQSASQYAPGKSLNADPGRQNNAACDDPQIIEKGRQRRNQEMFLCKLNGHKKPPDKEKELGGQNNSGHPDGERLDGWILDAGCEEGYQVIRIKPGRKDNHEQETSKRGEDQGENSPPFRFLMLDPIFVEDGDEGDGEKSGGRHMIQNLRQHEGHLIGVYFTPGSAHIGNDHFAQQADDPAQQNRGHHDEGCDADLFIEGSRLPCVFFPHGFFYGFFRCAHMDAALPGSVN